MKLWIWFKGIFDSKSYSSLRFIEIDRNKYYTEEEIIDLLSNEILRPIDGNFLVLQMLIRLKDRLDELEVR